MKRAMEYSSALRIVRVDRKGGLPSIYGHLWLRNSEFALLSPFDDGLSLDGFSVLFVEGNMSFCFDFEGVDFYRKILGNRVPLRLKRLAEHWDFEGLDKVINNFIVKGTMIMVHPERKNADLAWVGRPLSWTGKSLVLKTVSAFGQVTGDLKLKRKWLSRLDFDSRYLLVFSRLKLAD